MINIEELKNIPLYESIDELDTVQLVHLMIRSARWADYERPENYPVWNPSDAVWLFEHFFRKTVTAEHIARAFTYLQKQGLVRKVGKLGFCLVE